MGSKLNKMGNILCNTGKVMVAAAAGLVMGEVGFAGSMMLQGDAKVTKDVIKASQNPVYTKSGLLGKKQVSVINPVTGKVSPYTGSKTPTSKKVVKVKKGGR